MVTLYLIYLIGLVTFITLPYLLIKEHERPRYYQAIFFLWGLLWPYFLALWLVQIVIEKVKRRKR